jgi:hypothetical protein
VAGAQECSARRTQFALSSFVADALWMLCETNPIPLSAVGRLMAKTAVRDEPNLLFPSFVVDAPGCCARRTQSLFSLLGGRAQECFARRTQFLFRLIGWPTLKRAVRDEPNPSFHLSRGRRPRMLCETNPICSFAFERPTPTRAVRHEPNPPFVSRMTGARERSAIRTQFALSAYWLAGTQECSARRTQFGLSLSSG